MCWPFAKALPCAVDQGSQHNELYPLADSLPKLIGHPVFSTLMRFAICEAEPLSIHYELQDRHFPRYATISARVESCRNQLMHLSLT